MRSAARTAAVIILLFAAGLALGLVINGDGDESSSEVSEAIPLAPLAERPEAYLDRHVLVSAEVVEILGPRSFAIGGDDFAPGGRRILVVARRPVTIPGRDTTRRAVLEGDLVQVAAEVRTFEARAFEDEVGADLEADLSFYEGDPALFSESLTITPRLGPLGGEASPDEILARPRDFYREWVTVEATVERVIGDDAFTTGEGLLVLVPSGREAPAAGESVTISGPVRRLDPDQRPPPRGESDNDLFGDFADEPAVIAQRLAVEPED